VVQAPGPGLLQVPAGGQPLVDRGVAGGAQVADLVQRRQQYGGNVRILGFQGGVEQCFQHHLQRRIVAEGAKAQFLEQAGVPRGNLCRVQGQQGVEGALAAKHLGQDAGAGFPHLHGRIPLKTRPGVKSWGLPRRISAIAMGFLPGSWAWSMTRMPSPVATPRVLAPESTMVPGGAPGFSSIARANQMRIWVSPRGLKATGKGLKARTWRSSSLAGRRQSSWASCLVSLRA